jgi:long-chain fatty acid transport protein
MSLIDKCCLHAALIAAVTVATTGNALAAGFYLTQIGTPASLGTAGAANATNTVGADAAWTNPAGMTGIDSDVFVAGAQVVVPKMEFDPSRADAGGEDGGNAGNTAYIPSAFFVKKVSDRLRLGVSLVAPMGGGVNYGDDFVGRYATYKAELAGVALSPSIGYRVNDRFSIGAGVSVIYTQYEQGIALNPAALDPALAGLPDAKVRFDNATDIGYQPFAGITWAMTDRILLGMVYRAEMDVDLEGDVNIRNWKLPVNKPKVNEIDIGWDNPQWLDVGLRFKVNEDNFLFLNGGWQEWSEFSENGLEIPTGQGTVKTTLERDWDDTWYARAGFLHRLDSSRSFAFGISYDSSPVKDAKRTIDLPMDEYYQFSAAYGVGDEMGFSYSLGATLMLVGDTEIRQQTQGVTFAGDFDTNRILFLGGTLRYAF